MDQPQTTEGKQCTNIEVSSLTWDGEVIMMSEYPILPYFVVANKFSLGGIMEGSE